RLGKGLDARDRADADVDLAELVISDLRGLRRPAGLTFAHARTLAGPRPKEKRAKERAAAAGRGGRRWTASPNEKREAAVRAIAFSPIWLGIRRPSSRPAWPRRRPSLRRSSR